MANKSVFASVVGKLLPRPNDRNREGAPAYGYAPRHKLAQLAVTGCINATFYAEAREQLAEVVSLAQEVDAAFVAKTAVYCRQKGYMKDMPALLAAVLSMAGPDYLPVVFDRVVDNGKMLRNFVQIMRSGAVGRKSLGSRPKALVRRWLVEASDAALIRASIGQSPSLADVIRMVHPKPTDARREALFAHLIGKPCDAALLPQALRDLALFRADSSAPVPDVAFQLLTSSALSREHWAAIARRGGWHMLRMNLSTFARNRVYEVEGMTDAIAARLRDPDGIRKARVFPYQLMVAATMTGKAVPAAIREALQDAMEVAIANVPELGGRVAVCPDVSGSMASPVTGYRKGASSAVRCIDAAALVASAILRANRGAHVLPFAQGVVDLALNARDSVLTNAAKLAAIGGGGTNCSAPLARLNAWREKVDLVVLVSDNQSWVDHTRASDTGVMREWERLKNRNPGAKLVCIDLQPYGTTQAVERRDILNVGGFSDAVFEVIAAFARDELGPDHWVGQIERVEL